MRFALLALLIMFTACDPPQSEDARRERVEVKPATPEGKTLDPKALSQTTAPPPAPAPPAVPAPSPPWTATVRGNEVLLNRPTCAVSLRLDAKAVSLSIRAACTANDAPAAGDLSAALAALFAAHPGAKKTLKGLWTGPMARIDDGGWGRTLGAAALDDARWKTRARRVPGDPSENTVYVALVNESGASATFREVFGPHGITPTLARVEKVFTKPAQALLARGGQRAVPYDAGIHTFTLSPTAP